MWRCFMMWIYYHDTAILNRDFFLKHQLNRQAVGNVLFFKNAVCQGLLRVVIEHGDCSLKNDGARIQGLRYKVHGAPTHFDTRIQGLSLGVEPWERRKEGWMNIQNMIRKGF